MQRISRIKSFKCNKSRDFFIVNYWNEIFENETSMNMLYNLWMVENIHDLKISDRWMLLGKKFTDT